MASQAVKAFGGATLAHVGEWHGDTGDRGFESQLAAGWELAERLPLPCWGDTCEELTVWRRRTQKDSAPPTAHPVLACDACGAPARMSGAAPPKGGSGLRRCRYCRLACYCSAACEARGRSAHDRCAEIAISETTY